MKATTLFFILLGCGASALAQAPAPTRQPSVIKPPVPAPVESENVSRFDLEFPGGTPGQLVAALSKAMGKQLNVIIMDTAANVQIPAVRVRNATVNDVFSAIAVATRRDVAVPVSIQTQLGGAQNISYQYREIQSQFRPTGNQITDDTVWSFVTNEPEVLKAVEQRAEPPRELRHFQLRNYLSDSLGVEDITTAIRTGWEMAGVKNVPDLKFHQETGILIAAGEAKLLDQIPMVLQQLPPKSEGVDAHSPPPPPPTLPTRIPPRPGVQPPPQGLRSPVQDN